MGAIVGERFVRAANYALENRCPMICFAASGGARMQEALISLMQKQCGAGGLYSVKLWERACSRRRLVSDI